MPGRSPSKGRAPGRAPALHRNRSGAVAVEFAFVAGFLFMTLLGGVSIYDAYRASRKMDYAASALADLATRMTSMEQAAVTDLFAAGAIMLEQTGQSANLEILIAGVSNPVGNGILGNGTGGANDLSLDWSFSTDPSLGLTQSGLAALSLPDIFDGEGVVVVRVEGDYEALFPASNLSPTFRFSRQAVRRPRFTERVMLEAPAGSN